MVFVTPETFRMLAAMELVEVTLDARFGQPGETIADHPGVHCEAGLALVKRDGRWLLAYEAETFGEQLITRIVPPEKRHEGRLAPADHLVDIVSGHPDFAGRLTDGEFTQGRWYAVAVGVEVDDASVN